MSIIFITFSLLHLEHSEIMELLTYREHFETEEAWRCIYRLYGFSSFTRLDTKNIKEIFFTKFYKNLQSSQNIVEMFFPPDIKESILKMVEIYQVDFLRMISNFTEINYKNKSASCNYVCINDYLSSHITTEKTYFLTIDFYLYHDSDVPKHNKYFLCEEITD
jgi:hypothetical protein